MKILLLAIALCFGLSATAKTDKKMVDQGKSKITWKGWKEHIDSEHTGTVKVKSGYIAFNGKIPKNGEVIIDMTSINNTDLSGGMKKKLEGHLMSPDFFNVKKFKTAKLQITKVTPLKGKAKHYIAKGKLTIRKATKPIEFLVVESDGLYTSKIKIDRTDFGVKYGQGKMLKGLLDKVIAKDIEFKVALALKG